MSDIFRGGPGNRLHTLPERLSATPIDVARFLVPDPHDFQYGEMTNPPGEIVRLLGWATARGWFKVQDMHVERITRWVNSNGNAQYKLYLKSGQVFRLYDYCGSIPGYNTVGVTLVARLKDL